MNTIFVITCMRVTPFVNHPNVHAEITSTRPWGWFPTFAEAEEAVKTNDADIFEVGCGDFNYAVIEEIEWGTIATTVDSHWYRLESWSTATKEADVRACEPPNGAGCNYGLG